MIVLMRNMLLDDHEVRVCINTGCCSFSLSGLRTDGYLSTSGRLGLSHLESPSDIEAKHPDEVAVAAAENAAVIISDDGPFEMVGNIFAFDADTGSESRISVRFLPTLKYIWQIPTFRRNFRHMSDHASEFKLNNTDLEEVVTSAQNTKIGVGITLPLKITIGEQHVLVFLELLDLADNELKGVLHIFGDPRTVGSAGILTQVDDHGIEIEVGRFEKVPAV